MAVKARTVFVLRLVKLTHDEDHVVFANHAGIRCIIESVWFVLVGGKLAIRAAEVRLAKQENQKSFGEPTNFNRIQNFLLSCHRFSLVSNR